MNVLDLQKQSKKSIEQQYRKIFSGKAEPMRLWNVDINSIPCCFYEEFERERYVDENGEPYDATSLKEQLRELFVKLQNKAKQIYNNSTKEELMNNLTTLVQLDAALSNIMGWWTRAAEFIDPEDLTNLNMEREMFNLETYIDCYDKKVIKWQIISSELHYSMDELLK